MDPRVITQPDQITAAWLTDRLRNNGHLPQGEVAAIQLKKPPGPGYIPFEVTYSLGSAGHLPCAYFIKCHSPGPNGIIETTFFNQLLSTVPDISIVPCFDAKVDENSGYAHILLKDMSETHYIPSNLTHIATNDLELIVDQLFGLHRRWWQDTSLFDGMSTPSTNDILGFQQTVDLPLVQASCRLYENTLLPRFIDSMGASLPSNWRQICEKAVSCWPQLFEPRIMDTKAHTLIHGDAHAGNLFHPYESDKDQFVIFDCETCMYGIGVFDISFLLLMYEQHFDTRHEGLDTLLLKRYHTNIEESNIAGYNWEKCKYDFRLSIIAYVIRTLSKSNSDLIMRRLKSAISIFQDWNCEELLSRNQ